MLTLLGIKVKEGLNSDVVHISTLNYLFDPKSRSFRAVKKRNRGEVTYYVSSETHRIGNPVTIERLNEKKAFIVSKVEMTSLTHFTVDEAVLTSRVAYTDSEKRQLNITSLYEFLLLAILRGTPVKGITIKKIRKGDCANNYSICLTECSRKDVLEPYIHTVGYELCNESEYTLNPNIKSILGINCTPRYMLVTSSYYTTVIEKDKNSGRLIIGHPEKTNKRVVADLIATNTPVLYIKAYTLLKTYRPELGIFIGYDDSIVRPEDLYFSMFANDCNKCGYGVAQMQHNYIVVDTLCGRVILELEKSIYEGYLRTVLAKIKIF